VTIANVALTATVALARTLKPPLDVVVPIAHVVLTANVVRAALVALKAIFECLQTSICPPYCLSNVVFSYLDLNSFFDTFLHCFHILWMQ
jgi:hypothetical protein